MIRLATMLLCSLSPSYRMAMREKARMQGYSWYLAKKAARKAMLEALACEESEWAEDMRWQSYTGIYHHSYQLMGPGFLPKAVWRYLSRYK